MTQHFIYGFLMAFVGFITPAMLNMTTVQTVIEIDRKSGLRFGLGAATINSLQSLVAFLFIDLLTDNPHIIMWLKKIGMVVLFTLAYFFYNKALKPVQPKEPKEEMSSIFQGMLMSSINMLAIPYYFVSSLGLKTAGQISAIVPHVYFMSIGVFCGGLTVFSLYALLAKTISKKSEFITKNLNLILAGIFAILGFSVLVSLAAK